MKPQIETIKVVIASVAKQSQRIISAILVFAFAITTIPASSFALAPSSKFPVDSIDRINRLLSEVRYIGDKEAEKEMEDPTKARAIIKGLFSEGAFFVQNNRRQARRWNCTGSCWFCYVNKEAAGERLTQTKPMNTKDAADIIKGAIEIGFDDIQLNGEDTLDDMEAFWAIVDACKDQPIRFSFFTHGLHLVRHAEGSLGFFKELRRRLGDIGSFGLFISFDPEKAARVKNLPQFGGDEEKVYEALALVIHNFRQVFPAADEAPKGQRHLGRKYKLAIEARDLGADRGVLAEEAKDAFHVRIEDNLRKHFGHSVDDDGSYSHFGSLELKLENPAAVREGIKRGRIYRQFTIRELFEKILKNHGHRCEYSPFLDMSMSEITPCIRRQEYPRRALTPQTFRAALLGPFFNPRSRHLYLGEKRGLSMVKQIGFAMAIDPSLESGQQVSFVEVESHIFTDRDLMARIELLYLLEDILNSGTTGMSKKEVFTLAHVPHELLATLAQPDILHALCRYYTEYAQGEAPLYLHEIIDGYRADPDQAVEGLRRVILGSIAPTLAGQGIVSHSYAKAEPIELPKRSNIPERGKLPSLKDAGFNAEGFLQRHLSSDSRKNRRIGFSLLATMINDDQDITVFGDVLRSNLTPGHLSEEELLLAIRLLGQWVNEGTHDMRLAVDIALAIACNAQQARPRVEALRLLIYCDDLYVELRGRHILDQRMLMRLSDSHAFSMNGLDLTLKLKILRKRWELGLLTDSIATTAARGLVAGIIVDTSSDDAHRYDGLLDEIRRWFTPAPFMPMLQANFSSDKVGIFFKDEMLKILSGDEEGMRFLKAYVDDNTFETAGILYLVVLKALVEDPSAEAVAVKKLNAIPLSIFEADDIFVDSSHYGIFKKLLPYHKDPGAATLVRCASELRPGTSMLNAKKRWLALRVDLSRGAATRRMP